MLRLMSSYLITVLMYFVVLFLCILHAVLSLLLTHLSNRNQNIKDTSDTVKSSSNVHLYYEIDNEGRLRPNFTTKEMLASQL